MDAAVKAYFDAVPASRKEKVEKLHSVLRESGIAAPLVTFTLTRLPD